MFRELQARKRLADSGHPGLPLTPLEWLIKPMRALIKSRTERNRSDLPLLSVARERGVFVRSQGDGNHNVIPEDLTNHKVAKQGDLVINKMKAWQGSLGLAPREGIVSPAYYVYDFDIENRHYGQALLRSKPYVGLMGAASDGVRVGQWDLSVQRLRELPVLIPPAEEQAAIVKYLGHAHTRIDRAITAKRKMIALLEEQKRATIHQAVTRGLDPDVPLKDSAISWLGQIPAHWSTVRLRSVARFRSSSIDKVPVDGELPVRICNYVDVYKNTYIDDAQPFMVGTATPSEVSRFRLHHGDVLITKDSEDWRDIGVPALVRNPGSDLVSGYHLTIIRPDPDTARGEFVLRALGVNHIAAQLHTSANGVTRYGLPQLAIKNLLLALPPLEEQERISQEVARTETVIDAGSKRLTDEIGLLQEFRTRLTSDVVTGQVDVRKIAASLPELSLGMLANTSGVAGDSVGELVTDAQEAEE